MGIADSFLSSCGWLQKASKLKSEIYMQYYEMQVNKNTPLHDNSSEHISNKYIYVDRNIDVTLLRLALLLTVSEGKNTVSNKVI
jgi:hypothetical protein